MPISIPDGMPSLFRLAALVLSCVPTLEFQSQTGCQASSDSSVADDLAHVLQISIPDGMPSLFRLFKEYRIPLPVVRFQSQTGCQASSDTFSDSNLSHLS